MELAKEKVPEGFPRSLKSVDGKMRFGDWLIQVDEEYHVITRGHVSRFGPLNTYVNSSEGIIPHHIRKISHKFIASRGKEAALTATTLEDLIMKIWSFEEEESKNGKEKK